MHYVFADTGFLVAILRKADSLHRLAKKLNDETLQDTRVITSDLVCVEFLNSFSGQGELARRLALGLFYKIKQEPTYEIVPMTDSLHAETARRYQQASDQSWSYTDCSSFAIMHDRGIMDALTHDHHFIQAGFRALLRENIYG